MSGQHTPGPWRVADKSYGWDHFAAVLDNSGIVANCHIAALSRDHEQTAADARLIAAAPDGLALAEMAMRLIDGAALVERDHPQAGLRELRLAAEAFIAKATGVA